MIRSDRARRAVAPPLALLLMVLGSSRAGAETQLITNGGFEEGGGSLLSWTTADQPGGDGGFFPQSGTTSPILGDPVPGPPEGGFAAMTDAEGPGSHVLYQDVVLPTQQLLSATLSFDLFIGNRADVFATPDTLDFTGVMNQQARVDLLSPTADPFSLLAGDVLMDLYRTEVGDPAVSGYTTFSFDLTPLLSSRAGETVRLRFAEVDNLFSFQFGVDNVSLTVQAIPEPGTLTLVGIAALGLAGVGLRRRRRERR
ncbi:PEP-CTERM sorting domain-containing protein [Tautonia plasticadhaerens]|uniref:Ice-binding protein C-terminal domain-containing protein n=1 Tax=Tautonia plasticadhaerens TaxID=2527974 RepID=A0A518H5C7_9BACT|nr:PEP-CTERM sorting domain-containing protein [Tautonia plasticadhaerens]QDV36046.1 hypothetical protein ElP_39560 [Tautonia plasticadhaerens]